MIFSEQWLREWVSPSIETQELMDQLTMAGLEVDGCEGVAREFSNVVVAKIESVEKHPNADKLNVCVVSDGINEFQVVCGAPNARAGLFAPFAKVGAQLLAPGEPKPFKIKAAKLRGVESNGMLCSAEELGLDEKSDGLLELPSDAPIGQDVRRYLKLEDSSIELDLTPNRGDCLGMIGLAREVGVLARLGVNQPAIAVVTETITDSFPVSISAKDACPRYLGRVVKNIDLAAQTPLWMTEKLRRSGLRSIDPIVDVTNFVLMELGQPMHAFDLEKLADGINVRMAHANEALTLLDGKEVKLTDGTLVIADGQKAVAMAGIMGGLATSVTGTTKHVFLECAFFAPLSVAGKARSYGMHTDASHRYERGVDFELQHRAMARATQLLLDIAGGEAGPVVEALGHLPSQITVILKFASVEKLLGVHIEDDEIVDILTRLGFVLSNQSAEKVAVAVPSFRFDVSIEADLIEELARIYGYNNLPKTPGLTKQKLAAVTETQVPMASLRGHLVAQGFQEVVTYSFIDPALNAKVFGELDQPILLQNPISEEMSLMRPSILPGLLQTLQYNVNRQQDRIRLFESGLVFNKIAENTEQTPMIAGLLFGLRLPENWAAGKDSSDFFDLKGVLEGLLELSDGIDGYEFKQGVRNGFHDGQCAIVTHPIKGEVGVIGAIHPSTLRKLGLTGSVFAFELVLNKLRDRKMPVSQAPSKYPEMSRDLAIVVDENVPAQSILNEIRNKAGEFLVDLRIFDVYQGDAIEVGEKSIALGLTWQHPSRNLTDDEINTIITNSVNALQEQFNANLRN
ncbi:MAG: phenylalanyl-tRNA synthetase beta chain [Pseudohongiellaceae bacterium]|jgi:phenylalanyl-tRNA synthetase beta chain